MELNDIEFVEAVISIPKNTIRIKAEVETYEIGQGPLMLEGTYGPAEVREAINLFQETVEGEYPQYVFTEEGKKLAESLKRRAEE